MADGVLKDLTESLIEENGGGYGFVCIWRLGDRGPSDKKCTVGEFLSMAENQSGTWLIDGGWGGPPGPIYVRWNEEQKYWEYGSFMGRGFSSRK